MHSIFYAALFRLSSNWQPHRIRECGAHGVQISRIRNVVACWFSFHCKLAAFPATQPSVR